MTKVIIKYPNRKLYDKSISKYISLKDIHEMVKADVQLLVIENITKTDITRETVQESLHKYSVLDLEVMRHMIKNEVNEIL